uniref:Uncharacterized protein n=1 Tax=Oryza nivara TaxID=4536 RepID=A0A0E0IGM8_ORYNI
MEVEGIVKLRPLYASRRGVPGAALRPWVWVLPGFTTNGPTSGIPNTEERERRGAGAPVVERLRRRRQNMFPSDAHPGNQSASEGNKRGGRNGDGRSSTVATKRVAVRDMMHK